MEYMDLRHLKTKPSDHYTELVSSTCYLGDIGDLWVVFDWCYQELCPGWELDSFERGVGKVVKDTQQHWRGDDLQHFVGKRSNDYRKNDNKDKSMKIHNIELW